MSRISNAPRRSTGLWALALLSLLAVACGDNLDKPPASDAADVPAIEAPLMLHYAGLDERINAGWPAYEKALQKYGKQYEAFFYPGVNHGFHNDSTPRYDEAAAKLAWDRTIAWFSKYLA